MLSSLAPQLWRRGGCERLDKILHRTALKPRDSTVCCSLAGELIIIPGFLGAKWISSIHSNAQESGTFETEAIGFQLGDCH